MAPSLTLNSALNRSQIGPSPSRRFPSARETRSGVYYFLMACVVVYQPILDPVTPGGRDRSTSRALARAPRRAIYAVGIARWCESSGVGRGWEGCQRLGGYLAAELLAGVVV